MQRHSANQDKLKLKGYYTLKELVEEKNYKCVEEYKHGCIREDNNNCVVAFLMFTIETQLKLNELQGDRKEFYETLKDEYNKKYRLKCKQRGNRTSQETINTDVIFQWLKKNLPHLQIIPEPKIKVETGKKIPDFVICSANEKEKNIKKGEFDPNGTYYFLEFKGCGAIQHIGDALLQSMLIKDSLIRIRKLKEPEKQYHYSVLAFATNYRKFKVFGDWLIKVAKGYIYGLYTFHPALDVKNIEKEFKDLLESINNFFQDKRDFS